jgi:hypothetical protein
MSILTKLSKLSPWQVAHAVEAVPQLRKSAGEAHKEHVRELRAITHQLANMQKMLEQQQKLLAGLPLLRQKVHQCIEASIVDADLAERLIELRQRLRTADLRAFARRAVSRAELRLDPCPHVVIDELLPDEWCDELVNAIPSTVFFKSHNLTRQEMQVPFVFAPAYHRLVWDAFFREVIEGALVDGISEKFAGPLDTFVGHHWPSVGTMAAGGVRLEVTNSRLLLRRAGYEIKPHRDPRWAFLTCLVYLQKRDDVVTFGTQFYRLKQEREAAHSSPLWAEYDECELVTDLPARRNTAVIFLNSTGVHGATIPPEAPPDLKRFVYQVQFGPNEATRESLIATLPDDRRPMWAQARGTSRY